VKYKTVVHARIERKTLAQIEAIAKARKLKISSVVRELVEQALEGLRPNVRKEAKPT
jgi:antitoxin component of RelBE/YafQ-DinJ toxin-antitoxin module